MKTYSILFISLCALIFCTSSGLLAQNSIYGIVQDDQQQPQSFCNILLLNTQDSSLVKGALTDDDGKYQIENINAGSYIVKYSMIGFTPHFSTPQRIMPDRKTIDLGVVQLKANAQVLNTVEVKARKPLYEQKIDRLVVNIQNSITSTGSNALEVLERSPGVIVDRQNSGLSLSGKGGVVVMINGKINYSPIAAVVQMLEGMSADNIEKIELITTPPANLDAQGDAGYINIVLKENINTGWNGSLSLMAGYAKGEQNSANVSVNYRNNKLSLFANYSFLRNVSVQLFENYRSVVDGNNRLENFTKSDRDALQHNHSFRFGLDYELSDKTIIGFMTSGYDNEWSMDASNVNTTKINGVVDSMIDIVNDEINHWKHLMGNVNLNHTFGDAAKLNIDLDYLYYYNENPNGYINDYLGANNDFLFQIKTRASKTTPINIAVAKMDYTKSFGDNFKLETGVKSTRSQFENNILVEELELETWKADPDFTADFDLQENISAAYMAIDYKIDDKTDFKAGLRYEYTESNLGSPEEPNIIDRKYGNFFPSIFLSRTINDDNSINFAYSRRINRPTFRDMAPFIIFLDPTTFYSGNPAIQPSISNAVKVAYRLKSSMLSLEYTHEDEAIASHQNRFDPETNRQIWFTSNLDYRKTATLMLAVPIYVNDWWSMQNNAMGIWQEVGALYNDAQLNIQQKNLRFNSSQQFKLPKGFGFEISGFYQTASLFGTARMEATGMLNLGIQKKLNNNNGVFSFNVNDVLNSFELRSEQDIPELGLVTKFLGDFSQTQFRLSYSRNFGNKKLKGSRKRSTGSEAERRRVD
jgi:hypothetical protein